MIFVQPGRYTPATSAQHSAQQLRGWPLRTHRGAQAEPNAQGRAELRPAEVH